ncbi:hypothetical protein K3728_04155 [Rhodobacteraceae bacterium M385]|nr:hypothetical protein K3728_04155 [Rhodobacteraceae bacterium M385]
MKASALPGPFLWGMLVVIRVIQRATMHYCVERLVPSEFLLKLGIYLQTCAHIELAIWQIALEANGEDTDAELVKTEFVDWKLSTSALTKRLQQASAKVDAKIGLRIWLLNAAVRDGLLNRNAAAHGAFYSSQDNNSLKVSHYFSQGRGSSKRYFSAEESVDQDEIDRVLFEANCTLLDAIEVRDMLKASNRARTKPPPPSPRPPVTATRL